MQEIKTKLKDKIIEILDLDIDSAEIGDNDQLVGGDFGIDSIDVLEIVLMLDQEFAIKVDSKEEGEKIFMSINTLAEYVSKKSA